MIQLYILDFLSMRSKYNNTVIQYALIVCLGTALLFGQAFKSHMHIQHDGVTSSASTHIIDVHAVLTSHDVSYDKHHSEVDNHPHSTEIDVSVDSVATKIKLLNSIVLLFLVASIFLCIPLLRSIRIFAKHKTKLTSPNFLLSPPLRAPPR